MTQAVSHRPLTAKARGHAVVSACYICSKQSGIGRGFSLIYLVSPVNTIPPWLHIHILSGLEQRPDGRDMNNSQTNSDVSHFPATALAPFRCITATLRQKFLYIIFTVVTVSYVQ
jgi:hypothetical protein